ncbi:hypothetical protein [Bacillus weihaiensis]|nr:hypothetical protein [Bacillus weihaiensis]
MAVFNSAAKIQKLAGQFSVKLSATLSNCNILNLKTYRETGLLSLLL